MAALTVRKFLKYTLLPGFVPRLREIFTSGFYHIAFCMAMIYQSVRLLPPDHPYLQPANFGRYGVRHVIAEAANHLVISKRNADQVLIFFLLLAGLVLLVVQFGILIVALVAQQPAVAAAVPPVVPTVQNLIDVTSIYGHAVARPPQDIAFQILDRVFGLDVRIYGSCISDPGAICVDLHGNPVSDPGGAYPFAYHLALHDLLRFYSLGIFMVSMIVIIYFIITIVGETAITGSPFGQRFNKTWAPVRLILFFALLVPLNTGDNNAGLNSAQMLTFWAAKFGSNFATNAWGRFNQALNDESLLGLENTLIATPNPPEINALVRFMFVAKTCKITEEYAYGDKFGDGKYPPEGIQAYIVRDKLSDDLFPGADNLDFILSDFTQALEFSNYGNIEIRFGAYSPAKYPLERGNVNPVCGILTIPVTSLDGTAPGVSGGTAMQEVYYNMVTDMWTDPQITQNAQCIRDRVMALNHDPNCATWPDNNFAYNAIDTWKNYILAELPDVIDDQINNNEWGVTPRLLESGWAGAAIWYNRIAQANGEMSTAIANLPQGKQWPFLMEQIALQNKSKNENVSPEDLYDPALGGGKQVDYPRERDQSIALVYYNAYTFWEKTGATNSPQTQSTGNAFIDGINLVFGTQGIFSMRENTNIHPLAQLSALGKGMMDAAVRNLAIGFAGTGISPLLTKYVGKEVGGMSAAAAGFLLNMGKATMLMSFILYYVLPFLPFIYFMFAVSGWVKSIFEAVVAMPLWALSHISRLDGQGIAGPGANNGYFLLLEIFLRPILILFGLLASITIFSACVSVLNQIFDLVAQNVSGFDMEAEITGVGPTKIAFYRGAVDRLFFSILYVVMCYMMAMGFFKMVDQVPNNILRWMGVSVSTFSEAAGDPAGELTGKVYQGGSLISGQIKGGGQLAALFAK